MKHTGTINGEKVAVLFRTVPGEPTNALVVKHEALPEPIKNDLRICLESNAGQNALSLSDAANVFSLANGDKLLAALHIGNYIEKVATKDVILTPNANTTLPLDELNNIIEGAGGPKVKQPEAPTPMASINMNPAAPGGIPTVGLTESANSVISDEQLATDLRTQAAGLQAEATRLLSEAETLSPAPPKKRGRPAKNTA